MANDTDSLKQRALRAARAVTLSAAFVGAGACADDGGTPDTDGWNVGNNGGSDSGDATSDDASDIVDEDTGETCSIEPDDVCPDDCEMSNDADCCEFNGGFWEQYEDTGVCAVPGPFVPPELVA